MSGKKKPSNEACEARQAEPTEMKSNGGAPQPFGDAFVLRTVAGSPHPRGFWTGSGWSMNLADAKRFDDEPDPCLDARRERDRLGGCVSVYLPRRPVRKSTPPIAGGSQPSEDTQGDAT